MNPSLVDNHAARFANPQNFMKPSYSALDVMMMNGMRNNPASMRRWRCARMFMTSRRAHMERRSVCCAVKNLENRFGKKRPPAFERRASMIGREDSTELRTKRAGRVEIIGSARTIHCWQQSGCGSEINRFTWSLWPLMVSLIRNHGGDALRQR